MRIHYTGKLNTLAPTEEKRLATRFARLGALLDRGSEKEAHVILVKDRRGHSCEVTVNHRHHTLAGKAEGAEQMTVLTAALDKVEKQILKLKTKKADGKRRSESATRKTEPEMPVAAEALASETKATRIYRVRATRKPITPDEAVLLIGKKPYLVFRDTGTDATCVIIRRVDGHFDLIEG